MNLLVSMLAAVSIMSGAQKTREVPTPKGWSIEAYGASKYKGPSKIYKSSMSDLGSRRVNSVVVNGYWELCNEPDFKGECRKLRSSIADLGAWGFPGKVRSLRPIVVLKRS
jgi:hypothetical protein